MIKRIKSSKVLIGLLILISILIVMLAMSRAYISPNIDNPALTDINVSSCGYFTLHEDSNPLNLENSFPMSDNKGMILDPYTFTLKNSCDTDASFNIYLVVTNDSVIADEKIKTNITTEDTTMVSDLFKVNLEADINTQYETKTGETVKQAYLLKNATILAGSEYTFDFRMWIDKDAGNEIMNSLYEASIVIADAISGEVLIPTLAEACRGKKLADCFQEKEHIDENFIQHTVDNPDSAGDNNYRFSGSNEVVNNYITFNNEMWRIIGIYDGLVKLIRDEPISTSMSFDEADATYPDGLNKWEGADPSDETDDADINVYLNGIYYNSMTTTAKSMIKGVKYNIGTVPWDTTYKPKDFYNDEAVSQTINEYNIALIYPSDYLYGASEKYWGLLNYNGIYTADDNHYALNTNMQANNWMFEGENTWSIIPYETDFSVVWDIYFDGRANNYYANESYTIFPTVNLISSVVIADGLGTLTDPIQITMN